jgi:hypothetical protein
VGIRVIFAHIVTILRNWFMGRQFLEPDLIVVMQPGLIIVDKNRCGYMHGIAEYKTFSDPTFSQAFFDLGSDVDQSSARRYFKPEFFTITFHDDPLF